MTIDQLIAHLQTLRVSEGGDAKVKFSTNFVPDDDVEIDQIAPMTNSKGENYVAMCPLTF